MKNDEIEAVELVRRIRDEHSRILEDKMPEERIAFFREMANQVLKRAEERKRDEMRSVSCE